MKYLLLLVLFGCAQVPKPETPTLPEVTDQYSTTSTIEWIKETVSKANCVLKNAKFIDEVRLHGKFDYSQDTGKEVADKLISNAPVIVTNYCKKPSFGRQTNAYRNVGSNIVYMNTCVKLNSVERRVNTLIHERMHCVGYDHGNNDYRGKEGSVPYSVGKMAEKYVKECIK